MKNASFIILALVLAASCAQKPQASEKNQNPFMGTWKLVSATTIQGDSSSTDLFEGKEMIKIINETHFAFLNHDLNQGKDSLASFVSGGGKYTLVDNHYTEFLEYCNYREWEGNTFEFTVTINDDALIQRGIEKIEEINVDREIIETYVRFKN